jgi:hypothetical protein
MEQLCLRHVPTDLSHRQGVTSNPIQEQTCVLNPGYLAVVAPEAPIVDMAQQLPCAVTVARQFGYDGMVSSEAQFVNGTAVQGVDFRSANSTSVAAFDDCSPKSVCVPFAVNGTTAFRDSVVSFNVSLASTSNSSSLQALSPAQTAGVRILPFAGFIQVPVSDSTIQSRSVSVVQFWSRSRNNVYTIPLQRVIPVQPGVSNVSLSSFNWTSLDFNITCDQVRYESTVCQTTSQVVATEFVAVVAVMVTVGLWCV